MAEPVILSLCDETGNWSRPYREAGYRVVRVSINGTIPMAANDETLAEDVRFLRDLPFRATGILAAPPCTFFASSGARWVRTPEQMRDALSIVDACLRLVALHRPAWWALENPVGTLRRWLGRPALYFDPCDYGDPWTKKTCLWGSFAAPIKSPVVPTVAKWCDQWGGKSAKTKAMRSSTPLGFARAFFEANR